MLFSFSLLSAIKGKNTDAELQVNFSSLHEGTFFRGEQPNFRGEWLFAMMNGRFSVVKLKDACARRGYTGFTASMKQRYRTGVWILYGKPEREKKRMGMFVEYLAHPIYADQVFQ